jgi:formate/nitrite transporter
VAARAEAASTALPPPAVFNACVNTAKAKAGYPLLKTLTLGFTAGALIGIGALLMSHVGGGSPQLAASNPGLCNFLKGAVGLPTGLALVVLTGAELFTGNVMVMISGLLKGAVEMKDLVKNWVASYSANFAGSLFLAWLSFHAKTMAPPAMHAAAVGIATMKVSLPWTVAFSKAILCNWLVCLGVWGAMSSQSTGGKLLAIWLPISAFITLGFEHSVANMFLIPQGMLAGAKITWSQFIVNNLIPVTLGNIVGGAIFVAGVHYIAYGQSK